MDIQDTQGGERELDPRLCQHVHPEGHAKAGQQCRGGRTSTGYCPPHARALGLMPALPSPSAAAASAASSQEESREEAAQAAAAAQDLAQLSLSRSAAAWLASPKTQRRLQKRWDDILDNGNDAELIRLVKELTDRVEGRAGEARVEERVELPDELAELEAMSTEDLLRALQEN